MTYKLTFLKSAKKEWDKLTPVIQEQFKKKLKERLITPIVQKDKLFGLNDCFKIKLRSAGYRLVYKVMQKKITVQVVAVGKRDKSIVYHIAAERLKSDQ
jgi:mRNA interferase RelE/StbE